MFKFLKGVLGLLTITFVVLKLLGVFDPAWLPTVMLLAFIFVVVKGRKREK